jgi:branched-chain amino acid transport system substrate-binding protein
MSFAPDPRLLPSATEIAETFRAEGFDPEGYTLYTYAAVQMWAQAAEAAGSTEFDAVVQALNEGTFDTVLGELSFDDMGDTRLPYVFYEWSNGEYTQFTTPEGELLEAVQ